ncbi:MAG: hypothetical protein KF753_22215 [Caldilineaceae bacterium]|nr:hypothetical protein [Caldilineaceae bacterium]
MPAHIHLTANAETALLHLLSAADEEYLACYAKERGLCMKSLRRELSTPRQELTCPLCGQPSTHLLSCRGCGPDAWGDEFQLLHGETANGELREALGAALRKEGCDEEAVGYALPRAYIVGGCLLCPACWSQTWPRYIARSCPLFLLAERSLDGPGHFPDDYYLAALQGLSKEEWNRGVQERWSRDGREGVREWRLAISTQPLEDRLKSDT